jgi:hypothetical protein
MIFFVHPLNRISKNKQHFSSEQRTTNNDNEHRTTNNEQRNRTKYEKIKHSITHVILTGGVEAAYGAVTKKANNT